MSDQERAKALWTAVVKYRHQTAPPNEHLAGDWEAHDPVKIFNVYGYCMCCCCSALVEALNREDGREARGRILNGHSVPEVRYRNGWHMFDGSLITFFPRPGDGVVASVDEIAASIADWYAKHPGYQKNGDKIFQLMRKDGWMGWKSEGPPLLAHCPYYDWATCRPGRTAGTRRWSEYDRKSEVYEYGYQVGHRALFSLRPGESFVREAGNRGLHVNMDVDPNWDGLKARAPENDLVYVKEFFPGYRGGVAANGIHRYAPNLAAGDLASGAEVFDNLASGGSPALRVKAAGRPGVAVIPMISPYVYLGGRLRLKAVGRSAGDRLTVSISTNNGRTFAPIYSAALDRPTEAKIDLKDKIFRRYAYWLEIELDRRPRASTRSRSRTTSSTPRARCPGSARGRTRSRSRPTPTRRSPRGRSSAGSRPTRRSPRTRRAARWASSSTTSTSSTTPAGGRGAPGVMTVPVEVPGDLVGLGFSAQFRARGEKDRIRVVRQHRQRPDLARGRTLAGPTQGRTEHVRVGEVAAADAEGAPPVRDDRQQHGRRAELPDRRRLPRPHGREDGSSVPRRPPLEGRRTLRTETSPLPQVHDPARLPEMVSVSYEMATSRIAP